MDAATGDETRRLALGASRLSTPQLDHADGEIGSITKWIAEVEHERLALQGQLGRVVPGGRLTKSQVKALMVALRDIVSVLAEADVDDRAQLYQQLGVELRYHPDGRVAVEALPRQLVGSTLDSA